MQFWPEKSNLANKVAPPGSSAQNSVCSARAASRPALPMFLYCTYKTRELGSSGPYPMLFFLDDLDKKKHRDVINSLKNSFF